jgi:hypothetical protein
MVRPRPEVDVAAATDGCPRPRTPDAAVLIRMDTVLDPDDARQNAAWDRLIGLVLHAWVWRDDESVRDIEACLDGLRARLAIPRTPPGRTVRRRASAGGRCRRRGARRA